MENSNPDDIPSQKLTKEEQLEAEELVRPRAAMLYEVVRQEGVRELERTFGALWWSGVAAGLSMGFSILVMAVLKTTLPEQSPLAALINPLGYSVGFLIVILARQQLFTENTITAVLPLMADKGWDKLLRTARLWAIVLVANLVGTFLFTLFLMYGGAVGGDVLHGVHEIARHLIDKTGWEMFSGAVLSGWLVATMVWAMPASEGMSILVVLFITYVIGLLGASHIIAGSVETFFLVLTGDVSGLRAVTHFGVLTLLGNIVGGTTLFAMISYVQVREEIKRP